MKFLKNIFKIYFLFALTTPLLIYAQENENLPNPNNCELYFYLEKCQQCGVNGPYLNLGHKFCEKYRKKQKEDCCYLPKTNVWMDKVRVCLQKKALDSQKNKNLSCAEREVEFYNNHVDCYVKKGVCQLPLTDVIKIISVMGGEILHPPFLKNSVDVVLACLKEKKNLKNDKNRK